LQLRLEKAPLCPHRITAGAVDIYTQRDFWDLKKLLRNHLGPFICISTCI
jgi:hypothetical protein